MHGIRTIAGKELRQHLSMFLVVAVCLMLSLIASISYARSQSMTLGIIAPVLGFYVAIFLVVSSIVVSGNLVTNEYRHRTYQFVESLPTSAAAMLMVKYILGLLFQMAACGFGCGVVLYIASFSEPMSERFVAILLLKTGAYTIFIYSLVFLLSFVGRYRVVIYIVLFWSLMYISENTDIYLEEIIPFSLIEQTSLLERDIIPWSDIGWTLLVSMVFSVSSMMLALVRGGSIAESLSKKMTQQEGLSFVAIFSVLLFVFSTLDQKAAKEPYKPTGVFVQENNLSVSYRTDEKQAENLLTKVSTVLERLQQKLKLSRTIVVHVSLANHLAKDTFLTTRLTEADGVVIEANYLDQTLEQEQSLMAFIVREVLKNYTSSRVLFEPKRWVHDGFSWWLLQEVYPSEFMERKLTARAKTALKYVDNEYLFSKWNILKDKLGGALSESLGYMMLKRIEDTCGRDIVWKFVLPILARKSTRDTRETIHEWMNPIDKIFEDKTCQSWNHFKENIPKWITSQASSLGKEFDTQLFSGSVKVMINEDALAEVVAQFNKHGVENSEPVLCVLLHKKLDFTEGEPAKDELLRQEVFCEQSISEIKLLGQYGVGDYVFFALEYVSPSLGSTVRIHADRVVIK